MVNAWIPLVEALSVLSLTCFLVYKYADTKRTNWFSLVITAVSWFLAFSMIFFIPLDIYSVSYAANSFDRHSNFIIKLILTVCYELLLDFNERRGEQLPHLLVVLLLLDQFCAVGSRIARPWCLLGGRRLYYAWPPDLLRQAESAILCALCDPFHCLGVLLVPELCGQGYRWVGWRARGCPHGCQYDHRIVLAGSDIRLRHCKDSNDDVQFYQATETIWACSLQGSSVWRWNFRGSLWEKKLYSAASLCIEQYKLQW